MPEQQDHYEVFNGRPAAYRECACGYLTSSLLDFVVDRKLQRHIESATAVATAAAQTRLANAQAREIERQLPPERRA